MTYEQGHDNVVYRSLFGLLGPQTFPNDPFLANFRIADQLDTTDEGIFLRGFCLCGDYLYAMAALDGPAR
jgi:hypothetical protein